MPTATTREASRASSSARSARSMQSRCASTRWAAAPGSCACPISAKYGSRRLRAASFDERRRCRQSTNPLPSAAQLPLRRRRTGLEYELIGQQRLKLSVQELSFIEQIGFAQDPLLLVHTAQRTLARKKVGAELVDRPVNIRGRLVRQRVDPQPEAGQLRVELVIESRVCLVAGFCPRIGERLPRCVVRCCRQLRD